MGIVVCMVCMGVLPVTGQVRLGIRGGANASLLKWEKKSQMSEDIGGYHVGGTMEVMIPVINIGAEGSVLYVQEWGESKSYESIFRGDKKVKIRAKRLEVPIHGKWKVGVWGLKVYAVTGPNLIFPLSKEWEEIVEEAKSKRFGVAWDFGAGVEVLNHLQAGIEAGLNLTDDYEAKKVDVEKVLGGKQWGYRLTLAYLF